MRKLTIAARRTAADFGSLWHLARAAPMSAAACSPGIEIHAWLVIRGKSTVEEHAMLNPAHFTHEKPRYHKNLLLVKMRPAAAVMAARFASTAMATGQDFGMSAIARYERAGLIRRVVPLDGGGPVAAGGRPLAFAAQLAVAAAPPPGEAPSAVTGTSIVELAPNTNLHDLQLAMADDPNMEFVSPVPVRFLMAKRRTVKSKGKPARAISGARPAKAGIAAVPPAPETMWNLRKINWKPGLETATEISVAVLDTGVDQNHPDLPKKINYVHKYADGVGASDQDIIGHGTHVSGTIRALVNGMGINGICQCKLSVHKIFGDTPADEPTNDGRPYYPYYVDPILYHKALAACLAAKVQVINLSIGGYGEPDPQESALFGRLIQGGTVVVAAMGNEATGDLSYPAAIPGVIAVGASDLDDARAEFSNWGDHIALVAPGVKIWSTLPTYPGQTGFWAVAGSGGAWTRGPAMKRDTDYDAWDGTSMATPHVTAAVAMMLAKNPGLTPATAKSAIMKATETVPNMNGQAFTDAFGAGRLSLSKL